jgi:hypothetical protein
VYAAREKAAPSESFVKVGQRRLRLDRVDTGGLVCLRYKGHQCHLGVGRPYAGWRVAMLVEDRNVEVVALDGSPLGHVVIDPTKDYQKLH